VLWETSATLASVGYSVYAIAVPWFAFEFSSNFLIVGLVLFVEVGIYSLTFLIGPLVDRTRDKRTIYVVCYPIQAVAAAVLGVAIARGFLSLPLLFGLISVLSFLWDFTWAANNVAPRLLLDVDQLFRSSGLGTLLGGATQVGGYAVGALLIVKVGPGGGLLLYSGLLAAAALIVVPLSIRSTHSTSGRYLDDFREGWAQFRGRTGAALRALASVELVRGFFSVVPSVLLVVVAARLFVGGAGAYGVLSVAWVVGGVAVGLALGEWNPRARLGPILIGSAFASALFVALAVLPFWGLVGDAMLWGMFGGSATAYSTVFYVYLRGAYPPETVGRISANLYLFTGVAGSIGVAVVGALAGVWSVSELGLLVAVGFAGVGLMLVGSPTIRHLAF